MEEGNLYAAAPRVKSMPTNSRTVPCVVVFYATLAALGGMLFGFEISIISGAKLLLEKPSQLNLIDKPFLLGFTAVGMTVGAMIGTLCAGVLQVKVGRRFTIVISSCVYLLGAFISFLAHLSLSGGGVAILILGRIVTGMSVGTFSSTVPLYVAEVSPAFLRGKLVTSFQVCSLTCHFIRVLRSFL